MEAYSYQSGLKPPKFWDRNILHNACLVHRRMFSKSDGRAISRVDQRDIFSTSGDETGGIMTTLGDRSSVHRRDFMNTSGGTISTSVGIQIHGERTHET